MHQSNQKYSHKYIDDDMLVIVCCHDLVIWYGVCLYIPVRNSSLIFSIATQDPESTEPNIS